MPPSDDDHAPVAPWHVLLGPLPDDAVVKRGGVLPPEMTGHPNASAVAGWTRLTVDLSVPCVGSRHVLVLLDDEGYPMSANDHVLYRREITDDGDPRIESRQESVGGRIERDGTFRGTRWTSIAVEREGDDIASESFAGKIASTPSAPTQEEVEGLLALVAEVVLRARI